MKNKTGLNQFQGLLIVCWFALKVENIKRKIKNII